MAKYEIKKSHDLKYYWVFKSNNGEIVLRSQMYVSKQGSQSGIQASKNSLNDSNFKRHNSPNGQFYFTQVAKNGEVIGVSENYITKAGCENGINSIKGSAGSAFVTDLS
jgi:uncharacterized protein YegP (UPF0339 family)